MPQIVDQLLVVLDLDATKFNEGIAAAMATLQNFRAAVAPLDRELRNLGNAAQQAGSAGNVAGQGVSQGLGQTVSSARMAYLGFNDLNAAATKWVRGFNKEVNDMGNSAHKAGKKGQLGFTRMLSVGYLVSRALMQIVRDMNTIIMKLNELVGLGAMRKWSFEAADAANTLWRFSDGLRLNMVDLQAWHDAVSMYGGSASQFDSTVQNINARLGALGTNLRGAKITMTALGLSGITEEAIKSKDSLGVLLEIAKKMPGLDPRKQDAIRRAFRIDDKTSMMLRQAGDTMVPLLDALRKWANDPETVKTAAKNKLAWIVLNLEWEHAKMTLVTKLQPALKKVGELLEKLVEWVRENPDQARHIFYGLAIAVGTVAAALAILTVIAATLVLLALGPLAYFVYKITSGFDSASKSADTLSNKLKALYNTATPLWHILSAILPGSGPGGTAAHIIGLLGFKSLSLAPAPSAMSMMASHAASRSPSTSSVDIHNLNVVTQATDANGISRDMMGALHARMRGFGLVPMADTGVN
jgi:hypothetical protein